jgi:hypothetical protein
MKPTIEDLQRLLLDARDEGEAEEPANLEPSYLIGCLQTGARFALERAYGGNWSGVRLLALRALYLCALIAWEAGRRMAPVMQVNDGKGGLRPLDPPTSAETPAAKHDVEALASVARGRERASGLAIDAHRHLRAVLDFMWPVGGRMTSPTVVQKARAFLAGEAQATVPTCNFCNGALENQSFQGLADRVDEVQRLRKDLAEAKERADQSRREVLTEDEAHAATRARRAEVERDLAATKERLADAQHSFKRRADELDYLRAENRKALAAQNLAESEAAGLRAQLVDLETAIRGLVDRVEKGRA